MRTLQRILIGILLTAMQSAFAEVDFTCQSNCMNKGYMIDFCTEKCSYGRPSSQQQSGGYQPSGALGALQAGERDANNQAKQQLELIKQVLEIEKMKRELQNQQPTKASHNNQLPPNPRSEPRRGEWCPDIDDFCDSRGGFRADKTDAGKGKRDWCPDNNNFCE